MRPLAAVAAMQLARAAAYELCVGQDVGSILNYTKVFGPPPCVMAYASIDNLTAALWTGTAYGSGLEHASKTLDAMPPSTDIQLGLWLVGAEARLASGALDGAVEELRAFVRWAAPRTVWVRIGYEFDMPGNHYDPAAYKPAYRVVAAALASEPNARRVWHSWGFYETFGGHPLDAWWPGDEFVDACGVSVFQQAYGDSPLGDMKRPREVAAFCERKRKPLVVAESTPFGAGDAEPRAGLWERWYAPTLRFVEEYDVVLWSYINCDWDAMPMWRGGGWGDSRVEADPVLMEQWAAEVLRAPRLVATAPARFLGLALLAPVAAVLAWVLPRFARFEAHPARLGPEDTP
mmetsp:Transcript_16133/g.49888  ORF Transcript_16133/g.49888 Transcript_16133/m.49888 type:complete len:347 (-) Transcript_16133:24-1064(-)